MAALPDAGKLGLTAQLAFWRQNGRFPDEEADLAPAVVGHLASQIGVQADALDGYDWVGRTGRRHRRAILDHLAVAAFDEAAETRLRRWLADDLLPREPASAALEEEIALWFARERITRPGAYRLDRILHSAQAAHDDAALRRVADQLDVGACGRLNALLAYDGEGAAFSRLAADPGRIGLESLLAEIGKLSCCASLRCRLACYAVFTPTRSSGSGGGRRSRMPGSYAAILSAYAWHCLRFTAFRVRARSWTAWLSCWSK